MMGLKIWVSSIFDRIYFYIAHDVFRNLLYKLVFIRFYRHSFISSTSTKIELLIGT